MINVDFLAGFIIGFACKALINWGYQNKMKTIYWFKDKGLFTGASENIGMSSYLEVEHACDVKIKNNKIVKNRYGHNTKISNDNIQKLYIMNLDEQYNFFKNQKL